MCLHGEPTWGYLYRWFIPVLASTHRVVGPNHMGFGKSETPQDREYTLRSHAENLIALVQELDLARGGGGSGHLLLVAIDGATATVTPLAQLSDDGTITPLRTRRPDSSEGRRSSCGRPRTPADAGERVADGSQTGRIV